MYSWKIGISPGSQPRVGQWQGENSLWYFSLSSYLCPTDCGTQTYSNGLGNVENTPQMSFVGSHYSTPVPWAGYLLPQDRAAVSWGAITLATSSQYHCNCWSGQSFLPITGPMNRGLQGSKLPSSMGSNLALSGHHLNKPVPDFSAQPLLWE